MEKKSSKENSSPKINYEFGGPKGCLFIMVYSHFLPYFFWLCLELNKGYLIYPESLSIDSISKFFKSTFKYTWENALPNTYSISIYFVFIAFKTVFAFIGPGVWVKGLPVPSENNIRHDYLCNGAASWYVTLGAVFALERYGIWSIYTLAQNFGRVMTTSIIFSDILSFIIYYAAILQNKQIRMTNNFFYDFFMGSYLNPRIGFFDFKMWAEIRVSWTLLFLLTFSACQQQYHELGHLSYSMILIVTAHFLYSNACMKGEECIPTTWDIHYEKWGWMLIYWNLAGVPFVYCFPAFFILKNNPYMSPYAFYFLMVVLFIAYYIWDTSQSQKNRFKMQQKNTFVKRYTVPQLPWGTIENPKYLKTECGDVILVDGWWQFARKIHYTADIIMAFIWGLSCGFNAILPFYYPIFFFIMITHRANRDYVKCKNKYGKDWDKYCQMVPYTYIPGII